MAASKPTSQLSQQRHLLRYTQRPLRGLSGGSGFFPSRRWTLSLSDCLPGCLPPVFGVWLGLVWLLATRAHPVALPPWHISLPPTGKRSRGSTSIDFGENQLSPGLIGLSPLPTSHPSGFQPTPVRASTWCYPSFTLLMGRSPWLRVYPREPGPCGPLALLAGLAFAQAPPLNGLTLELPRRNSPDHNAKGTQSGVPHAEARDHPPTACRHVVSGSLSLPAQGCFSPVPHGTRPLSVTREYSLPWRVVPPASRPVSRVGRYLGSPLAMGLSIRLRGSHPLRQPVPGHFSSLSP
jgi:hypothetical protein